MKRDEQTGCLIWTKGKFPAGYGAARVKGISAQTTHRIAWILINGDIPDGDDLHHLPTCDKACCNVDHLEILTPANHIRRTMELGQMNIKGDNHWTRKHPENLLRGDEHPSRTHPERMARGMRNGRYTHPEKTLRGDNHPNSKITEAQVAQIPILRKQGWLQREIGALFGISQVRVGVIERDAKRKIKQ